MARPSGNLRGKLLGRGYTAIVALLCSASVAYAIHANSEAARADRAALSAQQWERDARATRTHRIRTAASLGLLIRQYNGLARRATVEQRQLLAVLTKARRRAASEKPGAAAPVQYSTQSIAVAQPIASSPAPAAPAAPVAASQPTTKTS